MYIKVKDRLLYIDGCSCVQGVMIFAVIDNCFTQLMSVITTFSDEKAIIARERAGK